MPSVNPQKEKRKKLIGVLLFGTTIIVGTVASENSLVADNEVPTGVIRVEEKGSGKFEKGTNVVTLTDTEWTDYRDGHIQIVDNATPGGLPSFTEHWEWKGIVHKAMKECLSDGEYRQLKNVVLNGKATNQLAYMQKVNSWLKDQRDNAECI